MISDLEAIDIISRIKQNLPSIMLSDISASDKGMLSILVYLSSCKEETYANTIANHLKISKARVAVLLKKLEKKGLITKYKSPTDARIEIVEMTSKGESQLNNIKLMTASTIQKIEQEIGKKDLEEFITILGKIKLAMDKK